MNLKTFARFGRRGRRLAWGGALTALLLAAGTTAIGDVHPDAKRLADQRRESLSLFAGPTAVLQGNAMQCGVRNNGDVCANVFNSPTGGGGFWPTGSQNQYIFNTGLQIAGIMGADGGPWANDTVGAYFFDARGTQPSGTPLTDVFNSLDADDLANWPEGAFIPQGSDIFQPVLQGRATASQQDSWVQYWDGDPARISARAHPMGITVTQRSLAWNFPAGNESLIYFLYNFRNDTDNAEFQRLNEGQFFAGNNALPDAGITLQDIYAAFSTDMDVTANAGANFSTAILPFDLGISYHGGFSAPEFSYPSDLFFPPFFTNAPGLIGVKYLRSPVDPATSEEVGLTLFSATLNSSTGFPDPVGDKQLWRYLSGKLNPSQGDFPCNVTPEFVSPSPDAVQRSICFLAQTAADTRFYQASGPFSMTPGSEATIVVAYIAAATVATLPNGNPTGILANNSNDSANPPGVPSFHPGFPSARGCTSLASVPGSCSEVDNSNPVKAIERGAGWVAYTGPAPTSALEGPAHKLPLASETGEPFFQVVPGSLLGRSLVAQTIFDSRFLLGFAPEQPNFFLVPGDNQVTVVWEQSATETNGEGDPFFAVANDETSALFNPNYRQFDVEGYRVWRGTSSGTLDLEAQFDYANTTFTDVTCETVAPSEDLHDNSSAPEGTIGFAAGEVCPADFSKTVVVDAGLTFNNGQAGGNPGAGVFRLIDGSAAFSTDPLVAVDEDDEAGPSLPLQNAGVPFVYVDTEVVNNFTYFYAVSAFDVNSPASGPQSLRSARVTKSTVPRADSPNITSASLSSFVTDGDGNVLVQGTMPAVDEDDGRFLGPIPPTNAAAISQSFAPLVPRLLPQLNIQARIDSVKPDWVAQAGCVSGAIAFQSTCWRMWISSGGNTIEVAGEASNWHSFGRPDFTVTEALIAEVPFDREALDAFGIPNASGFATATFTLDESINFNNWEGQQNRRAATAHTTPGGPRWFSGTTETTPDPTALIRVGHLAEVDSVWIPIHHTNVDAAGNQLANSGTVQFFGYFVAHLGRSADIQVTWGEGGSVEVRDVTHNVDVPFHADYGSSWGFLNTDCDGSGAVDWIDFFCVSPGSTEWENQALGFAVPDASLETTPTIGPIGLDAQFPQGQTHTGFAMYLNGMRHFFVASEPPPAGTVWTLRNYHGAITSSEATALTTDPSGYAYQPVYDTGGAANGWGSPLVPGLTLNFQVEEATNFDAPPDLTSVHTVPDPYLGSSLYDRAPTSKQLMFVNLPPQATIRIYTLTGVLVDVLVHDDITGGGRTVWDVRNRNDQFVASGVYFFHVMTPSGDQHVGKFTIINQAGSN